MKKEEAKKRNWSKGDACNLAGIEIWRGCKSQRCSNPTLYSCEFQNVGLERVCCIQFEIGVRMDEPLLNKASDHMVYSFLMTKMSWLFHKTSSKRVPLSTDRQTVST
jgi:hypothetical protein